jgi:uncharacterized membrane protein
MGTFPEQLWKIVVFIGIQYALGRRGSYPYGLLIKFSLVKISLIVIISDIFLTLLLLNLLDLAVEKIGWLRRWKIRLDSKKNKGRKGSLWGKIKRYGTPGLVLAAALPYGGGALTGSIMAFSMKLDKRRAFIFIMAGCIIGTILFHLGFLGILALIK